MYKFLGIALLVFALATAIIPQFTDCQSQGKAISLPDGRTIPMKCHWTARAEIAVAVPLLAVGALMIVSRRKGSSRDLSIMGGVLGILVVLLPSSLIGVCQSQMLCNTVMKPALLALGSLVIITSLVGLVATLKKRVSTVSILGLSFRNIKENGIRSLIIFLCVLGIAGFFVSTTLIIWGAENSLQKWIERLGADILVVPEGAETKFETALLMGKPTEVWMSADYLHRIAAVPGVAAVSPQIYLQSLYSASCCSVSETFLVAFDPSTDFTITPWLQRKLGRELHKGEVIGGSYIFVPPDEKYIKLYGTNLTLKGNLEPTGTGIDQTIFLTMETAQDMAAASWTTAERPLKIPSGNISSIMVKVQPGADPHKVALQTMLDVGGVVPIESPGLFGASRQQILGLLWGLVVLLSIGWTLSAVLVGLVFSIAANERRREMAVLRALGAPRHFIFRSLLSEAALLAAGAGTLGIILGTFAIALTLSLATVTLAAMFPAYRISQQEPALAMRE